MEVKLENLCARFTKGPQVVEVFSEVNLTIPSGTSRAIVGKSGVGKTTLLYQLGILEAPAEGELYLGDTCVSKELRKGKDMSLFRANNIGFVFQFHQLLPEFSALENVAMPLLIIGVSQSEAYQRARKILAEVGLEHRFEHRPGELSGGEQQRAALARAMVSEPGLILADEPTGNLDEATGQKVMDLLFEQQERLGSTLVLVTHARDIASRAEQTLELRKDGLHNLVNEIV